MSENNTFEKIMERMFENVPRNVDKREAAIIYDALAPCALELANTNIRIDTVVDEGFADSASYMYLIKRAAERGISPRMATQAVVKGVFTPETAGIPEGARFNLGVHNYAVFEHITGGEYKLLCETEGTEGNKYFGKITPVDYIEGLQYGEITELLIPGEDDEDVEAFRNRYFSSFDNQAFGGNIAGYTEHVNGIPGVGGVKVYPAFVGGYKPSDLLPPVGAETLLDDVNAPAETLAWIKRLYGMITEGVVTVGGGTVKLIVITSDYGIPSQTLIDVVQTLTDPVQNHGEGVGIAPIGHVVTVEGVAGITVDIATNIVFRDNWIWEDTKPYVEQAIDDYFLELAAVWDTSDSLIVRISQIETRLLELPGVIDIADTVLNGKAQNLVLGTNDIPVRGDVVAIR